MLASGARGHTLAFVLRYMDTFELLIGVLWILIVILLFLIAYRLDRGEKDGL